MPFCAIEHSGAHFAKTKCVLYPEKWIKGSTDIIAPDVISSKVFGLLLRNGSFAKLSCAQMECFG